MILTELQDFIARALTDIAEGVRKAQDATKHLDTRINPHRGTTTGGRSRDVVTVEFNVAIKDTKGSSVGGKINVLTGILGGGVKGDLKEDSSAATSLKFCVPMILPSENDLSKHQKA